MKVMFILWLLHSEKPTEIGVYPTKALCEEQRKAIVSDTGFASYRFVCVETYK